MMPATTPSPRNAGVLSFVPSFQTLTTFRRVRIVVVGIAEPNSERERKKEEPTMEVFRVRVVLLRSTPIIRA